MYTASKWGASRHSGGVRSALALWPSWPVYSPVFSSRINSSLSFLGSHSLFFLAPLRCLGPAWSKQRSSSRTCSCPIEFWQARRFDPATWYQRPLNWERPPIRLTVGTKLNFLFSQVLVATPMVWSVSGTVLWKMKTPLAAFHVDLKMNHFYCLEMLWPIILEPFFQLFLNSFWTLFWTMKQFFDHSLNCP